MSRNSKKGLSRRERQIMDVLYRLECASVIEIGAELPDAPTDTAIRTHLRILEARGHVKRRREGRKDIYRPAISKARAARVAIAGVLRTFFDGSLGEAVAAHLADPSSEINDAELERLSALVREARRKSE